MKKIDIAKELLKNSSPYYRYLIQEYIDAEDIAEDELGGELKRFGYCIEYIEKVGFDITGWQLREIPTNYAHVFENSKEKKMFDLAVFDKEDLTPRFLSSDCEEEDAKSIEEAIEKYIHF